MVSLPTLRTPFVGQWRPLNRSSQLRGNPDKLVFRSDSFRISAPEVALLQVLRSRGDDARALVADSLCTIAVGTFAPSSRRPGASRRSYQPSVSPRLLSLLRRASAAGLAFICCRRATRRACHPRRHGAAPIGWRCRTWPPAGAVALNSRPPLATKHGLPSHWYRQLGDEH